MPSKNMQKLRKTWCLSQDGPHLVHALRYLEAAGCLPGTSLRSLETAGCLRDEFDVFRGGWVPAPLCLDRGKPQHCLGDAVHCGGFMGDAQQKHAKTRKTRRYRVRARGWTNPCLSFLLNLYIPQTCVGRVLFLVFHHASSRFEVFRRI